MNLFNAYVQVLGFISFLPNYCLTLWKTVLLFMLECLVVFWFFSCFLDNIYQMGLDNNVSQNATKIYTLLVMWIHPKSKES